MRVVGLLSGGKDSCFNLVHCVQNGHEIVALASLGPPPGQEEMDSYMYQTVGQDAIEVVAAAMHLPLVRRVISGSAVNQTSEYGNRKALSAVDGDETEDMYQLLLSVKQRYPNVEAVSVGAILSNYQRVRVEHVCRRLNLTPLSYLWQRNQGELLQEMIDVGLVAILIKVAGAGLTEGHLGKTLAEMQPTLIKLNELYGSHICGEGGEYETLTVDCPLFTSKINLVDTEIVIHDPSDSGKVAFLRVKKAILARKDDSPVPHIPTSIFEPSNIALRDSIREIYSDSVDLPPALDFSTLKAPSLPMKSRQRGRWVAISNAEFSGEGSTDLSLEDEVRGCFGVICEGLARYQLELMHISHINIFISSMDLFGRINAVYATMFGINPPTRACVAVDLPAGCRMRMDCIAYAEESPRDRVALHVQGISYWAPANIGPYSQSIVVGEEVFISGQIGLIPSSMQLPSGLDLATEAALAFQHVERVLRCVMESISGPWKGIPQVGLIWTAAPELISGAREGWKVYMRDKPAVQGLFVACKSIPKSGLIEVQLLHHTGRAQVLDADLDELVDEDVPRFYHADTSEEDGCYYFAKTGSISLGIIAGKHHTLPSTLQDTISASTSSCLSARLFVVEGRAEGPSFALVLSLLQDVPTTVVPSRAVATLEGDWDWALILFSTSLD